MPGLDGNVHHGSQRHVRFCEETVYGEVPGAPTWVDAPYLEDGFKLKATAEPWMPDTNYEGFVDPSVAVQHAQEVTGDYTTLLWPQIAEALLDMALFRDAANEDLISYAFDHYAPADPRRYRGVVAERVEIASTGSGDGDVRITLGLRGQVEVQNADLESGDFDYSDIDERPFMFGDAALYVDGVRAVDIDEWTLAAENELAIGPYGRLAGVTHSCVGYLIAGRRSITLDLTRVNRLDELNDAIREAERLSWEARFVHPLGHALQIQLPVLVVPSSDEDGTPSQVTKESTPMVALPNDAGTCIAYGVDLATGGTTTLAPLTTTTVAPTTTTTAA